MVNTYKLKLEPTLAQLKDKTIAKLPILLSAKPISEITKVVADAGYLVTVDGEQFMIPGPLFDHFYKIPGVR